MKKYLSLVKLLFIQQFKSRASVSGSSSKKRAGGLVAIIVILALCFAPMLISMAVAMYYMGKASNGNVYIGTFLTLSCQGLVLMFGLHAIISNVFTVRDADKLLYLPVRSPTIFFAKLTVAYINEVITTAVTVLFVLLPFGIGSGATVAYYFMLVLSIALIPMLPMLVACIVSMPFSALIARIGKNSTVKTVLRIVVYLLIMGAYMYAMYSFGFFAGSESGNILDNPEQYMQDMVSGFIDRLSSVMPYFHPNYMLMSAMMATSFTGWLVGFGITLGEHILLLGVVFLVSLPFYRKMLTFSVEYGSGGVRKLGKGQYKLGKNGIVKELMLTDLKRTVRDGQMGFQSFAGVIMMPIIVVLLYFFMGIADEGDTSFLQLMEVSKLYQVITPLVVLIYMTFIGLGTNVMGLYPISRENMSVYVLKSLPVSFSKILLSKVLVATAVMLISDFVTCLLIVLLLGVKWYFGLAMLATMSLMGFGSMCITTLLDLKDPRFGWANFQQNLKNSKNSWIAMLIGFLLGLATALISVMFIVWYSFTSVWYAILLMWLVIFGAMFAFAVVSYKIMTGKATKYFEKLEV
ncbi:MAG: ABC transporter permease [Clostridiales bacterium]|nr:ABC transporter permease [Clostridiales bacterium]